MENLLKGRKIMLDFMNFEKALIKQFRCVTKNQTHLFVVDADKDELWNIYLDSFPEGTNEIYKERREFDCNCCKSFIRNYAGLVSIHENKIVSIWDNINVEYPFNVVANTLSEKIHGSKIKGVFFSGMQDLGTEGNIQVCDTGNVISWNHFYLKLPKKFVNPRECYFGELKAQTLADKEVFERSMKELTLDAGLTILELIEQNSLYRGSEFKSTIDKFVKYKREFDRLSSEELDNWCWKNSINNPVSRIRNSAIGTLLIDISEDMELDSAVRRFENVMAPSNYRRPNAIFTKRMVEEAEKKIVDMGLENSLARKYATLEDINVNNVLFINRDARRRVSGSVFDELKKEVPNNPKKFKRVQEIGIEEFISNVIPNSNNIELLVENKHSANFMSLVGPKDTNATSILKWNNNFSWAYEGDTADSIKNNVKKAGGNIKGVLRFSIQWNDIGENLNDYDAHCIEPSGNHIYFRNKRNPRTNGRLDVDIIEPKGVAVENITWTNKRLMQEGKYKFFVNNYSHRGGTNGFAAEIEYDGQIYSFEYRRNLLKRADVTVAEIKFSRKNGIKFIKSLDSTLSSREIWNLSTNNFHKVSTIMLSPNYWDGQDGIGNKHYFFFLEGARNKGLPRGFFNEFLNNKLTPHRKVFEALGSKMRVEDSDNQLSGLGFSSTQKNQITVKVEGKTSRILKVNL
jgi:hypothetical protein